MSEFVDQYLPSAVPGVGFVASPRFKTSIQVTAGGNERRNREWQHPLHFFSLPEATARQWSVVSALKDHFMVMGGPECTWPLRDPNDFASATLLKPNLVPTVTMTDQVLGVGNGVTENFQITKRYTSGTRTYDRPIYLPIVDSVVVAIEGILVPSSDYTVTRPGGVVQFDTAPANNDEITIGYLFDVPVRFESDDALEQIMRATKVAGFSDLTLTEVRPC